VTQTATRPQPHSMGPLRLVHLIANALSGGAQQQLSYLAREQHRAGYDVGIVFVQDGPKRERLAASGAWMHQIEGLGNYDPRIAVRLGGMLRRLQPDIVQTWLTQMDVLGGCAARWAGRPWILSERTSAAAYPAGVKNKLRELLGRHADAIVSNSGTGDHYWACLAHGDALRRVIPNSVPTEEIAAAPPAQVVLPPSHKMVLHAGRFSPEKNLETLIPALGALTTRMPVTAYLCGDGTHEEESRRQIVRLGLEQGVRMVGYVDDIWGWMKRADVFVSVSHFEGQPNAVLEAAASGCPLLLSDIPEHRAMLDASEAAFVRADSPTRVADALATVLLDTHGAQRRAQAARRRVAALSSAEMARRYDEIYREVMARHRSWRDS
jgi:glycosyltransferase involved in cell wall biosynthesis